MTALVVSSVAACGAATTATPAPTPAASAPSAPISDDAGLVLSSPPPDVGDGMICAAAADRMARVADGLDYAALAKGPNAPQNPTIQQAITQFLAASSPGAQDDANQTIVGQCAAYGFDPGAFDSCVTDALKTVKPAQAAHDCVANKHRWTVYSQQ